MPLFTALNFTPDDALHEAEQHSRELQVEESFRVFQSALFHLKAKRFAEAAEKFKELFNIDVIKPDRWGMYKFSSPTLDTLRYLAYRNRGVFFYQYLRENYQSMSSEDIVDHILKVIENLLEAIQHSDCDIAVSKLLVTISKSFRTKKLERYILEYEILKEPEFITTIKRRKNILPETQKCIHELSLLLREIKDEQSLHSDFIADLTNFIHGKEFAQLELPPVLSKIKDMKVCDEDALNELNVVEIDLDEPSWEGIAESLMAALPKFKNANFFGRISDPYSEAVEPFEHVKLILNNPDFPAEKNDVKDPDGENIEGVPKNKNDSLEAPADDTNVATESSKRSLEHSEASRSIQRSSKRFKEKSQVIDEPEVMSVHQSFFDEINRVSIAVGSEIRFEIEKFSPEEIPQTLPASTALTDLYDCLSSWTNRHSEFLNQNESRPSRNSNADTESTFQLNSLFRTSVLTDDNSPTTSLTDLPVESVKQFISDMNSKKPHFQEIRLRFLDTLLSTNTQGSCLIIDTFWSPVLLKTVEAFVLGTETNLFKMVEPQSSKFISLGFSIYEIMVNMMGDIYTGISNKKQQGQKSSDLESQKNKLERKVARWSVLLEGTTSDSVRSEFRYLWTKFCYLQYTTDITDNKLVDSLNEIETRMKKSSVVVDIPYANYSNIPRFNLKTVQNQLSRINMIRKVTAIDVTMREKEDTTTEQQIDILRRALTGETADSEKLTSEETSMIDFITNSPFLLKIKLWKILVSFFSENDRAKLQVIYFKILGVLYEKVCSEDYVAQSQLQRQQTLLATINSIGTFSTEFLKVFSIKENWKFIDKTFLPHNIRLLLNVAYLLYPIIFYESMCHKDNSLKSFFRKAVKSSAKLKNIFTDILSLSILLFYIHICVVPSPDENSSALEFIWATHSLMGRFGFCDASNGVFLNLAELLLCESTNESSFSQLKQVLWCRYHLLVSGDNSVSDQHITKPIKMSEGSAIAIGTYLIKFHYQNKNPLLATGNKTNLKQILDHVVQVIGDLNISGNHILCRNRFYFEKFLDSPITTRILRGAFMGELSLEFSKPNDHLQAAVNSGVFFVAGVQTLNLYKIRKKATQARPSELDSIISMLKTDILYNTGRLESWFLLGKCYSYVVEDDLIWTSDKLAVVEKRKGTTNMQRKAILCYLMALGISKRSSLHTHSDQLIDNDVILKDLLETLSEEMLNGYLKPMDKSCYHWEPPATVRLRDDGEITTSSLYDKQLISDYNIQQGILFGLVKANKLSDKNESKSNPRSWKNLYYISKLQFKANIQDFTDGGYEILLEACQLAGIVSKSKNPILEPHYFLVVSLYKSFKIGILTENEALAIISKNKEFFQKEESFWIVSAIDGHEKQGFFEKIVELLRVILGYDKMKWHHRPKYRIARILYEDLNDLNGAISEMDELMFLKSNNKNLVNIWKPDLERPGKHFVYTYQYVILYLDMLFCNDDYISIALVAKKLRRFGPGMINVGLATERAMRLFCLCVHSKFEVDEKEHAEHLLPSLNYQIFLTTSAELFQQFNKEDYDPKVLEVLAHAYQLKKGNNSYDGICLAVYFKFLYLPFAKTKDTMKDNQLSSTTNAENDTDLSLSIVNSSAKSKGSSNRKRVSKKDAFDKIANIVEKKIT